MKNTAKKHCSEEFKKEAIKRAIEGRFSSSKELGLNQPILSKWVRQFKRKDSAVFSQDGAEIKKLPTENNRLKVGRTILKQAISFFAKHETDSFCS